MKLAGCWSYNKKCQLQKHEYYPSSIFNTDKTLLGRRCAVLDALLQDGHRLENIIKIKRSIPSMRHLSCKDRIKSQSVFIRETQNKEDMIEAFRCVWGINRVLKLLE